MALETPFLSAVMQAPLILHPGRTMRRESLLLPATRTRFLELQLRWFTRKTCLHPLFMTLCNAQWFPGLLTVESIPWGPPSVRAMRPGPMCMCELLMCIRRPRGLM